MLPEGITTYDLGHGLTLIRDQGADCFEYAWIVAETSDLLNTDNYNRWWENVYYLNDVDPRLLAVLAEKFVPGVNITLRGE